MTDANSLLSDVIVVGAGMVGSAVALGLARQGLKVSLVEAFAPAATFNPEIVDNRVSALTRATQNLLEKLGVWSEMRAMRVSAYTDMRVWDADGDGSIHFDAAELGEPGLGHIVENHVTQLALWKALVADDNIHIICPDVVVEVKRAHGQSTVELQSGQLLQAPLVIAADGKNSAIRQMLGIETRGWLYDQHALVASVTTRGKHQHTAWQRFMPGGPLAFLPLSHQGEHCCSIVWSTTPEMAQQLLSMDEQEFCQALSLASEEKLGRVTEVRDRGVFPLELKHATSYIREGFALVGDAAHTIHPLAGQGVNLGFLDVGALLDIVSEATRQGRNIGGMHALRRYERARKGSNMAMLASMDVFKRLFSNRVRPLSVVRNAGLSLVDRLGPVKQFFVRVAMGLD